MYTCGIIVESVANTEILQEVAAYFDRERIEQVPAESIPVWHIRQYSVPQDELASLLPKLAAAIKPGWYIHLFNVQGGVLYIVLKGRYSKLPTRRD
jgi:hypothetical protein